MPVHLGRLKLVVRRKEGKCNYKHCPRDHIVSAGEKVFILTIGGSIKGRPGMVVFYKAYHRECFGPWADYMWETKEIPSDGRPRIALPPETKAVRAKLVRDRARLLRQLRIVTKGDKLTSLVERVARIDKEIRAIGFPVGVYSGRRSKASMKLERFVQDVKEHYQDPRRVPRSMWVEAANIGMELQFNEAMDGWHREVVAKAQERQGEDWETAHTDKEEE